MKIKFATFKRFYTRRTIRMVAHFYLVILKQESLVSLLSTDCDFFFSFCTVTSMEYLLLLFGK